MIWKPRVTVAAVAERAGKFLVVEEQIDGKTCFNQPAGHLEDNESLTEAVVRECLEETAWHFSPTALVGIYRWRNPATSSTYIRVTFAGECTRHEPERELDADITAAHWMNIDTILTLGEQLRSPLVITSFEDYLDGRRYPIELLTDIDAGFAP